MLPSARSPFVRTVFTTLVLLCGTAAVRAQPCDPPIAPPQISAPAQVCPYSPSVASVVPPAQGSWVSVSWSMSNGGFVDENGNPVMYPSGETVRFYGNGSGPVTLSAYATDSFGCSTSQPGSVEVQIRTIPAPQITAPPQVCPYRPAEASVVPPAEGSWASVSWTINNGGFVDANGNPVMYPSGETVRFYGNGSGPVTLYAYAADSFGCSTSQQGSTEVQIRTIPAPQINAPAEVCPYRPAEASVLPPAEGSWVSVSWSITNGGFVDANGNPVMFPSGETVRFYGNGSGPVTLSAYAADSFGCSTSQQGLAEVQIRTIAGPQISAPPQVCTYTPAVASVLPPAEGAWVHISWTITDGGFVDENGNPVMYPSGETVRFYAYDSEPVTLFAYGQDSFGCSEQGTITIPSVSGGGAPPSIVLSSPDICATEPVSAHLDTLFSTYTWTVTNGSITSGNGTNEIFFEANGDGPVTVSVTTDSGTCPATDSETLPLRGEPAQLFAPSSACAGSLQKAWAPNWYTGVYWTVANATIEGPADGLDVLFRATGSGPVVLSLRAFNNDGCFVSNSVSIPLGGYPVPTIGTPQGDTMCPGGTLGVQADDFYDGYYWHVSNATILDGQGTAFVTFQHTPGAGDVAVTLNVGDGECSAYATRTIPVRTTVDMVAELAAPDVCPNGTGTLYFDNYDSFSYVAPYLTNGTIIATSAGRVPGGRTYTFRNNGAGDTTILLQGDSSSCLVTASLTAAMLPEPTATITASGPTTFCLGGSVTLTASDGASYLWSTGATTQSIVVMSSGSHTVTVTNVDGCSKTSAATNVTVNSPPAATITASGPTTFCEGGSVTLTAAAGTSYLWSNGATTQSIVVSASGSYFVTITNASGCSGYSAATNVTVHPNPAATITPSGPTTFCQGGSVTLTAPASASYLWSTGATTQSIVVSAAGSYSVTVTNANGCSRTSAPVSVTANPSTAITTQPLSQTMPRSSTRTLSVAATGTATLQYQWYQGASGNTSTPLAGQTGSTLTVGPYNKKGTYQYWVRVTSTGCPGSSANSNTATITAN
ncbi:MAG TPA: hypothetical protein VF432_03315 [Thermoanaerobaculia bacterium]